MRTQILLISFGLSRLLSVEAQVQFELFKSSDDVLERRDETIELPVANAKTHYRSRMYIGAQLQEVEVLIDTGSSDFWVIDQEIECNGYNALLKCPNHATFDKSGSTSFRRNKDLGDFSISYGDGSSAKGIYGSDNIRLGSVNGPVIKAANFAVANDTSSSEAVCGIGMLAGESMAKNINYMGQVWPTYSNLPVQMKEQGLIQHTSYSLWLNELDELEGSLLFGAIDHSKFEGDLQRVPLIASKNLPMPIDFSVMLHGLTYHNAVTSESLLTSCNMRVLIDCGTTYSMLPMRLITPLMQEIGAEFSEGHNIYVLPGEKFDSVKNNSIIFNLSGVEIRTPLRELLVPMFSQGPLDSHSASYYVTLLPVSDSKSSTYILSDSFLKNAYVVFDLENKEIALAQSRTNGGSDRQIELIGKDGIKSIKKAPLYGNTKSAFKVVTIKSDAKPDVKDTNGTAAHQGNTSTSTRVSSANSAATGTAISESPSSSGLLSSSSASTNNGLALKLHKILFSLALFVGVLI